MIARKEWFKRRKYGGWGVSPKSWQGWVYIAFILTPFMVFQALPLWTTETRMIVAVTWMIFLFVDLIPVMITLKRDEREGKIEAISERNAAWFMSLTLTIGIFYEVLASSINQTFAVNIFLLIALLGGAIVKSISNYKLERKKL